MNRLCFYQFTCKPSSNRVISKIIPLLSVIMICFQLSPVLCADFTANWSGSWTSYDGSSGSVSANLNQTGASVTGIMSLTNTECGNPSNLSLTGSVSNDVVNFQSAYTCPLDGSYNQLQFTNGRISVSWSEKSGQA